MHFIQSKEAYRKGRALVFHNIDYLMLTVKVLQKDYMHLASCLVPMGDQVGMTRQELADMLRTKTRMFTQDDIDKKFKASPGSKHKRSPYVLRATLSKIISRVQESLSILARRSMQISGEDRRQKLQ